MHTQPLVSVLIPLFNKADYFEETMASVLNQTYPNIEVIIVDDGSTDGSFELAKSYVSKNIFLLKQENKGSSSARNKAFEYAKGDFIQYIDADDVLDVRKIEEQINTLGGQTDVLTNAKGKGFIIQKNGEKQLFDRKLLCKNYDDKSKFLFDEVQEAALVHSWLIPRNLIEKAGKWDETMTIFDDRDFYLRLVPLASSIVYCSEAICYWRLPNSSEHLSQRNNIADFEAVLRYFLRFEQTLLQPNNSKNEEIRLALACLYKKLLVKSYTQKSIVEEIHNRCFRLGLVPHCSNSPIIGQLKRLFGLKIAFKILFFKIVFEDKYLRFFRKTNPI